MKFKWSRNAPFLNAGIGRKLLLQAQLTTRLDDDVMGKISFTPGLKAKCRIRQE